VAAIVVLPEDAVDNGRQGGAAATMSTSGAKTSEAQWRELDRELDQLLDLDPETRAARLLALDQEQPRIAARLRRLLAGLSRSESLEHIAETPLYADALSRLPGTLHEGQRLGDWTLVGRIGQGGMAEVFEAERFLDQACQYAAIKVMSLGMGGEELRRRFLQETQILARLDDPRLSRLIDAGTAPDGRPWLAMEFVNGDPIDEACSWQGLGIEERVDLVIEVAGALDHAHRQLVIHRDLKPANILLDNEGKVRVLDFGIARMLEDGGDGARTATHAQAYTLSWASPEQLAGEPAGVASDVYQLGLLLYRLLTGHRAFEAAEGDALRLLAAMRAGAQRPSQRLKATDNTALSRHWRRLAGDLDSIILHALEADPRARYAGARELAEDLERWRQGRPIKARPATRRYLAARWLRRHWFGATASAVIAILLVGYAVTATWQGMRLAAERNAAELARLRAESMHGFLLKLIGSGDPQDAENRGRDIDELLVDGVTQARADFKGQPLLLAQLLSDIGGIMLNRSRESDADASLSEALALREAGLGAAHPDSMDVRFALADARFRLGRWTDARELLMRQLEQASSTSNPDVWRIPALRLLGAVESSAGNIAEAETHLAEALRHLEARGEPDDAKVWLQRSELEAQLATVLLRDRRFDEALPLLRRALDRHLQQFGETDQRTLAVRTNLAYALRMSKQPDAAEAELRQVLAAHRILHDAPHRDIATTLGHLANLASDRGDYDGAVEIWREARSEAIAALGEDHPWITMLELPIARSLLLGGHREEGRRILQRLAALKDREDSLADQAAAALAKYDAQP